MFQSIETNNPNKPSSSPLETTEAPLENIDIAPNNNINNNEYVNNNNVSFSEGPSINLDKSNVVSVAYSENKEEVSPFNHDKKSLGAFNNNNVTNNNNNNVNETDAENIFETGSQNNNLNRQHWYYLFF